MRTRTRLATTAPTMSAVCPLDPSPGPPLLSSVVAGLDVEPCVGWEGWEVLIVVLDCVVCTVVDLLVLVVSGLVTVLCVWVVLWLLCIVVVVVVVTSLHSSRNLISSTARLRSSPVMLTSTAKLKVRPNQLLQPESGRLARWVSAAAPPATHLTTARCHIPLSPALTATSVSSSAPPTRCRTESSANSELLQKLYLARDQLSN